MALHSFRLKLFSVKYIAQCTLLAMKLKYLADLGEARGHDQTVKDCSSSYKIPCVIVTKNFVNSERHHNRITGSEIKPFSWRGGFCLLVKLHREGSVPVAWAAGLFQRHFVYLYFIETSTYIPTVLSPLYYPYCLPSLLSPLQLPLLHDVSVIYAALLRLQLPGMMCKRCVRIY